MKLIDNIDGKRQSVIGDNTGRLEQYRTQTLLVEENGTRYVYKVAASESAKNFLRTIIERELQTKQLLENKFEVLTGDLENDYIRYEFLPYSSIEQEIRRHFHSGDWQQANEVFTKYIEKISSIATVHIIPGEFLRTIAGESPEYKPVLECLSRGLIDLIPRNIFITGKSFLVLDNEWSFDFPVPVNFVIFRALRELATRLQTEIRMTACSENPVMAVFAGGANTYYVPVAWARYLGKTPSLNRMIRWESNFQSYVTGDKFPVGRIAFFKRVKTNFKDIGSNPCCIHKLLARIPGLKSFIRKIERHLLFMQG